MQSNPNQTELKAMPELAVALGMDKILIKLESQNPSGSHKDRVIWPMIDHYIKQGIVHLIIPSSGNAAISAGYYCRINKTTSLDIFVSPNLPVEKKRRLENFTRGQKNIKIHSVHNVKRAAIRLAKESAGQLLRTSTDNSGLSGYEKLAGELTDQIQNLNDIIDEYSIFVPTSSGTTLVGLARGFSKTSIKPRLNIVQTAKVNIMSRYFDRDFTPAAKSLASAIVDDIGHRQGEVIDQIKNFRGWGWVVSDDELKQASSSFKENPGFDSLLALAGLIKAVKSKNIKKAVLLFGGK